MRVTVAEKSGAVELTTSSMSIEIKAIKEILAYLEEKACKRVAIVTNSLSTLQKIRKKAALCRLDQPHHCKQSPDSDMDFLSRALKHPGQ